VEGLVSTLTQAPEGAATKLELGETAAPQREAAAPTHAAVRNVAVDAYRGLVMVLMMAEVLQLSRVAAAYPSSLFWHVLAWNQTHTEWFGCSLHDTIQPGFSFLVGVALPYSIASRMAKGATFGKLVAHALWRSLVLVALGVFLRSMDHAMTYFTFEDTLSQIGLGYPILFLLGWHSYKAERPRGAADAQKPSAAPKADWAKLVWASLAVILVAYWLAWAIYPAAPANFDWNTVGVSRDWNAQHNFTGFAAHWNKNYNLGNRFDQWFLNLFPREHPFVYNDGGYLTLSFIPTLGTMILGLIAGLWLRAAAPRIPLKNLLIAGVAGILLGLALHYSGICPIVKRIWTPSWTVFSGGICFLFLAALCWLIKVKGWKKWAFPLVVVGMNSIAAYCIAHLTEDFFASSLRIHLGAHFFAFAGAGLEPFFRGAAILLCYWLLLLWMYRRKLFLKI
jgi:heparan-alpha-glucosaminide N-acetyltransferase